MNQKLLIPILGVTTLALAGVIGARAVKANDGITNYPPVVQKLAEKFNLNQDEVKGVFDEERQQREQERQQVMGERLNQAVADGVITEEQKQTLIDRQAQMEAERTQHREEMQKWMEETGIDWEKLATYGGGWNHHHFGQWHMGMM